LLLGVKLRVLIRPAALVLVEVRVAAAYTLVPVRLLTVAVSAWLKKENKPAGVTQRLRNRKEGYSSHGFRNL
jgi:hypothetical protein